MPAPSSRPYAVVVGLDCITGLQTARILAARGVPVLGVATDVRHFCCRTRACEEVVPAKTATAELVEALERLGPRLGEKAVLYPCTDASVLVLSRERDRLAEWYHLALPEAGVVETLVDKVAFYTYADEQGLPIPRTLFLRNRADVEEAAETLRYPAVLKPPVKTASWERQADAKVYRVDSAGELLGTYDRVAGWSDLLLVQEWIEGGEDSLYSCNCYFDRAGEPLVTFVARKLRQWPPLTGTSSLGEECRNDVVLEETLRLFRAVGYHGLGYVEMKRDTRTGQHYIIEPNIGRPTGRSAIAEAGGVELLYAMYCDLVGLPLPEGLEQRYTGAKWIYWRADLPAAVFAWRRGELTPSGWLRSIRGKRYDAVLSWSDPVPFVLDFVGVPKAVAKRLARQAAPAVAAVAPGAVSGTPAQEAQRS